MKFTRRLLVISLALTSALLAGGASRVLGDCGPLTDVTFFCSPILELYYLGITGGTSPTTYAPSQTTTRGEIAAFVARSFNQAVKRTSRRAALGHWWTPQEPQNLGMTAVGTRPILCQSDGTDVWVANSIDSTVSRVRASDGKVLETWTGATGAWAVLAAMGRIFVTGGTVPGSVYMIDPREAPGAVTAVATDLGFPSGIAFDGSRIWVANQLPTISIVTPGATLPWAVTNVSIGPPGYSSYEGILFDGSNIWVANAGGGLFKLDSSGAVLQTVAVGIYSRYPTFDGSNIWVPNAGDDTVSVVRASTGTVLATLSGNGLRSPSSAAFDGERVLVTNQVGDSVSLWRAADLTPLGSFSTRAGTNPTGACSDGLNFWISLREAGQIARF